MSQFNLDSEISNIVRMDNVSGVGGGPKIRWHRKMNDSCNNMSITDSILNSSSSNSSFCQTAKTPMKSLNKSLNNSKTPHRTPSRTGRNAKTPAKTPSNKTTPSRLADRFIPNRAASQYDLAHHLITTRNSEDGEAAFSTQQMRRSIQENIQGAESANSRILAYQQKPPSAPEGYQSNLRVLYSQSSTSTTKKAARSIPQVPERILDAPCLVDDYYLNLVDWSCNNHMAVCLGGCLFLWDAASGEIKQLMEMENPEEYVTSVSWIKEGNFLAVGTSNAEVMVWDVEKQKRLRCMTGHAGRVGSLAWNSHILSSGARSGKIHHHDVRMAEHLVSSLDGHAQEVCGLKWSPDGKYLASGGNDNLLNIWSAVPGQSYSASTPIHSFTQHQAAVKALAWCPWQSSLLASGGGTADRNIRFWNVSTGTCVKSVDTGSQVCSILWSKEYKELVSSHGYARNQLIIWKYPSMEKVTELVGHSARVLHLAMSPDGQTVASAAPDETVRLWNCFAVDPEKKKKHRAVKVEKPSFLMKSIR